jgi:hypothetical protein
MAITTLSKDFREFLKLFNLNGVEYLVVGGYAVNVHGYVRNTNDLDIWVKATPENATRIDRALREFGFTTPLLSPELFLTPNNVVRMGSPPVRIEILTSISGVDFDTCFAERATIDLDELVLPVIGLPRLRENKKASGRAKDLADLENLPTQICKT